MTPEQIEELARQIVSQGLPIDWKVYVVMCVLALLTGAIGAAVVSFYSKRGEIKAIHDQLEKVEEQTRRIANVVEHEKSLAWVEQKRWDLKREIYTELIQRLERLMAIHTRMIHILASNNQVSPELNAESLIATVDIMPTISVARIFLSNDALLAFREWGDGIGKARVLSEQIGPSAVHVPYASRVPVLEALRSSTGRVIDLVVESAKRDLVLS